MKSEDQIVQIELPSERDRRVYDADRSGFRSRPMPIDPDLAERQRLKFYQWEAERRKVRELPCA